MAMFGSNNTRSNPKENVELSTANTSIARGAILTGDLETTGTIRIEGKIFGNVVSKSKTSVGGTGYVEGNILAQNAEIAGEIKGTVKVVEVLTLKATAIIHGDILCGNFVVEPGAKFIGKCDMGKPIEEIVIDDKEKASSSQRKTNWSSSLTDSMGSDPNGKSKDKEKAKKTTLS